MLLITRREFQDLILCSTVLLEKQAETEQEALMFESNSYHKE